MSNTIRYNFNKDREDRKGYLRKYIQEAGNLSVGEAIQFTHVPLSMDLGFQRGLFLLLEQNYGAGVFETSILKHRKVSQVCARRVAA